MVATAKSLVQWRWRWPSVMCRVPPLCERVCCCVPKMARFRTQIDGSKAKIEFHCALQSDKALLALPPHELQTQ